MRKVIFVTALAIGMGFAGCNKQWCEEEELKISSQYLIDIEEVDHLALSLEDKAIRKAKITKAYAEALDDLSDKCD